MIRKLHLLQLENDLKIPAFVLMRNHFHLMLLSPSENIDRVMYFFMKDVTKKIQKDSGRINKIFGGRYKGCLISDENYLLNAYKYIYRNPVAAGASERAENYQFSTLYYLERNVDLSVKLEPLFEKANYLEWINHDFEKDDAERMRWGLSRSVFQMKRRR